MKLDIDKIEDIYGNSSIYELKDNMNELIENMNYLVSRGFTDVYDIVEKYPYMFLIDKKVFKEKVSNLINKLGVEFIEKLEKDFTLWGEIDD